MFKETAVCIVIIISIFILDNRTQNYTEETISDTTIKLEELREGIISTNRNGEELSKSINEIYNDWMEHHDKLAFYIEHDELEKVETDMVSLKGSIEVGEYEIAVSELDKSVFVLQHIQDKYKFNLENIF
jgi:hypothetical protein